MSSSTEFGQGQAQAAPLAELLSAIGALLDLPDGVLRDAGRADLEDARERILARRVNVAVVGEFKRGKSTLVNALLGMPLVPTGILPLTSAVTLLRHGDRERLLVHFLDGHEEQHPLDRLARYATEAGNPGNRLGVELTVVETPSPFLADGMQVIDTPGTGSVHAHNTHAAESFFPRIDAAVVVLSADQPLSAAERELLATIDGMAGACIVVANRIDRLGERDRGPVLRFLRETLAGAGHVAEVLPVSATEGTGLTALRAAVNRIARADADAVMLAARHGAVVRVAASARSAAALEARALELPRADLELRKHRFAALIDALTPAREAATAVLERSVATALRAHVAEPLRELAAARGGELRADVEHQAAALPGSPRALRRDLAGWVDERVRTCIEAVACDLEAGLSAELQRLADRYAGHVEEVLARIADGVADAFGERPCWQAPQIVLADRPPFHYKLRDEGEGLGDAVSVARSLAPGRTGRRLVVGEAQERLVGLVDRHAGRLREQLDARALAAARAYRSELEAMVDAAADSVHAAVERGSEELERGSAHAGARRAELHRAIATTDRIAAALGAEGGGGV